MGFFKSDSTRTDLDLDKWYMHHMSISHRSNKQKKLLKELIHMYKILQILDIIILHPNICIVRGLWYRGEISPKLENPPTWKDTVIYTTSRRTLCNAHTASQQSILHF
jgi:hypothetical protein